MPNRLLGEDLAAAAEYADEAILSSKNFGAFCDALAALASRDDLPTAQIEQYLQNLRHGSELLESARSAFTFDAPRSAWAPEAHLISAVLRSASRSFSTQVAPYLPGRERAV